MYNLELVKLSEELTITANIIDENIFFKCNFYEGEKGIFIYYDKIENQGPYPIVLFRQKKEDKIQTWEELDEVNINSYIFNTNLNFNDFIVLSKNYIIFSTVSTDKKILYIVLLNILEPKSKVKIRYYVLRTFGLYHYIFYLDLRLNTYKNFIALTSSYCNKEECEEGSVHNNSLIIFNYPNSTDYEKNIIDELFENNEIIFNLSLRNKVTIENNIFGFIYSKIIIKSIEDCDTLNLISSTNDSAIIDIDYELKFDEDINITFNNYNLFNCKIGYIYEATEPDYETFEKYPEKIDISNGDDTKEKFNRKKSEYRGRLSYYNLYLNDEITNECSDNCILCYNDQTKSCIVCNYEHHINVINGKQKKICSEEGNELTELATDEATYKYSDQQTEVLTDKITDKNTDKNTEKITDKITDKYTSKEVDTTDKITDIPITKPTDKPTEKQEGKQEGKNQCSNEEIIASQCTHGIVNNDQFSDLEKDVENKFLKEYEGEKKKIETENIVFQMEKYDEQSEEDSLSYIDLGKCEKLLKINYTIPEDESLIIFIVDINIGIINQV
jgi:hypothetical protein